MAKKTIVTSGKRKRAIARATLTAGTGTIKINNLLLNYYGTPIARQRILEPLLLAGADAEKVDIRVRVSGGGQTGQADAVRLAIGRALAEHKPSLKSVLLDYDRQLLVADVRRKEVRKPNSHGKARAKRQKSYR
ncbi:30S ribosomal protein S9 [Candidatus Woesearchaeota archaeon]|nr:MAG: 30S ribosomal protein S9 [Candidatus Woesearchaeota archaeon]